MDNLCDMQQTIMQDHINDIVKKQEDFILSVFKKQKGFVSLEESKNMIEVNQMIHNGHHVGTDYIFNGKRILTIYPFEFNEVDGKFTSTFNYLEH